MTAIRRWDPLREMTTLRHAMDRFFEEPFLDAPHLWERSMGDMSLALDIAENDDEYTVTASVPGIEPDKIEITLADNVLTIRGSIEEGSESEEVNYHIRERRVGNFRRTVTLPMAVEIDKVDAVNENGILTLHLPKAEAVKPKRIEIHKQVEAR